MRTLLLLSLLLLVSAGVDAQRLPALDLQDGAGKRVSTGSLIDHATPFVVCIWTTTCKHCIKELDAISDEFLNWKEAFPLRVFAVSLDDSRSLQRAVALAAGRDWEGIVPLFDPHGNLQRALNIYSYPRTFVYDSEGNLFYTHTGYLPGDEEELLSQIRKCFAGYSSL